LHCFDHWICTVLGLHFALIWLLHLCCIRLSFGIDLGTELILYQAFIWLDFVFFWHEVWIFLLILVLNLHCFTLVSALPDAEVSFIEVIWILY